MRRNELETGVDVFDDEGNSLGKSVTVSQGRCHAAVGGLHSLPVFFTLRFQNVIKCLEQRLS